MKNPYINDDWKDADLAPGTDDPKPDEQAPTWAVVVAVAVVLLFMWKAADAIFPKSRVTVPVTSSQSRHPGWTSEGNMKSDMQFYCQSLTKQVLKAPGSASFESYRDTDFRLFIENGTRHSVAFYVDAQNSFGALVRSDVRCLFDWNPRDEKPTLVAFYFDGEQLY